ncbi:MAG: DUF3000 family protein [Actinomycetaceae bacterium]|nr:DUF3000 family protein [Actinomycetaceae bacterium]
MTIDFIPEDFTQAVTSLKNHIFPPEIHITQIPPPLHLAPYSVALHADITDTTTHTYLGEGSFVLLYDHEEQENWNGNMRITLFATTPIDPLLSEDPLLGEVTWSYLKDSFHHVNAAFHSLHGTVTKVYNETFSDVTSENSDAHIELRASLTPETPNCASHLQGWSLLLSTLSGISINDFSSLDSTSPLHHVS